MAGQGQAGYYTFIKKGKLKAHIEREREETAEHCTGDSEAPGRPVARLHLPLNALITRRERKCANERGSVALFPAANYSIRL